MLNRIRTIRKRWLVVTAAAALMAVGLTAGAVFAAGSPQRHFDRDTTPAMKTYPASGTHHASQEQFIARVAEILGIEPETVSNAFATAQHELATEHFDARIATLVENGDLTEEQGEAASAWFAARPADAGFIAFFAAATADTDRLTKMLDHAVANELLTQEQADAIIAWHADRPESLPEHDRGMFGKRGRHGHGHDRRGEDRDGDDRDDATQRSMLIVPSNTSAGDAG